ncbi:MAG: alpha/beta hydrolase [Bdellovibrionales bacterium]
MRFIVPAILIFCTACAPLRAFHSPNDTLLESSLTGCALEEKTQFDAFNAEQLAWYQQRGQLPIGNFRSVFHHGLNGRAVVLVHGFDSSPVPAQDMIETLEGAGFTVIAPLLTGFSSTSDIANASTSEDYLGAVEKAVTVAKTCNPEVSVISHSLGGTLVMDALLNRGLTGISHHIALSPFLKPSTMVHLLDTTFFPTTQVLSIADLQSYLGPIDPYMFLPISPPPAGAPPLYIPVTALHGVLNYSATLAADSAPASEVPTLAVFTDDDGVMDVAVSSAFVSTEFSHTTKIIYPQSESIGHGLETRHGNPHFDQMMQQILTFISGS